MATSENLKTKVIFVDVDDTLIRTVGTRRIPVVHVVNEVKRLSAAGHQLTCWSSGGADYAQEVAAELGLEGCFGAFLAKPQVLIDDQDPSEWRYLQIKHPNEIS